ncbi:MAG: hypothetical protein HYU52_00595 [Acidobacteria bacterium]|nr:hypothetical protein [Acidobacteriota bacterium]
MKQTGTLTIMSLLSILFLTVHLADDIVRGYEKGGVSTLNAVAICTVWLCGTLLLSERRMGYIVVLLFSILGTGIPYLHMRGKGLGAAIAGTSGGFFFAWTLIALGVTTAFSVILSVRGLWILRNEKKG